MSVRVKYRADRAQNLISLISFICRLRYYTYDFKVYLNEYGFVWKKFIFFVVITLKFANFLEYLYEYPVKLKVTLVHWFRKQLANAAHKKYMIFWGCTPTSYLNLVGWLVKTNMSEHAAERKESHQETFWSSLKDSFNFLQLYLFGTFCTFLANTSFRLPPCWNALHHRGRENGGHRYNQTAHSFTTHHYKNL